MLSELEKKLEAKKVEYLNSLQTKRLLMGTGIIGQLMVLAVVIILSVLLAIVVYMFINIGTTVGALSASQKGNVTVIANSGASTLQFLPLLALVIIVGIIVSVLLGIFVVRR